MRHGNTKHGMHGSPEYDAWCGIKKRCYNPGHKQFPNYGARGIGVCERWRNDFETFLSDMGRRPSARHSIDRIDNDRDYEPSNCRWALPQEQISNRRNTMIITAFGRTAPLSEFVDYRSDEARYHQVRYRIRRGWDAERALSACPESV